MRKFTVGKIWSELEQNMLNEVDLEKIRQVLNRFQEFLKNTRVLKEKDVKELLAACAVGEAKKEIFLIMLCKLVNESITAKQYIGPKITEIQFDNGEMEIKTENSEPKVDQKLADTQQVTPPPVIPMAEKEETIRPIPRKTAPEEPKIMLRPTENSPKSLPEKIIQHLEQKPSTLAEITMETRSRSGETKNILSLLRKLGIVKTVYDEPLKKHYFSVVYPVPNNLEKIVIAAEIILSAAEAGKKEVYEKELRKLVLQKDTLKEKVWETTLKLLKKAGTISIYNCPSATEAKRVIKIINPAETITYKPST